MSRLAADEFPHQRAGTYLNHAASSPLPRRTSRALRCHLDDRERLFDLYRAGAQDVDDGPLRRKVGTLLNVQPDDIAFAPTTTDAIAGALNSIDWQAGDNVVVPANEFPGVLVPCLALGRRGVEVRQVPVASHVDLARVLDAVDARTRAVAISHVHWQTGHRVDLARLGAACRASGALSIVDAIQSVGAVPVDAAAAGIDFLAAGAYKWLMAIPGTAIVYASGRFVERTWPDRAGYKGVADPFRERPGLDWLPGAARFIVGGPINSALIALEHSLDLLLEVGVAAIFAHVSAVLDRLVDLAPRAGLVVRSDLSAPHRSTFLNVSSGTLSRDHGIVDALVKQGIVVGVRGPGIRVAPHLHNSTDDVEALIDAIARL